MSPEAFTKIPFLLLFFFVANSYAQEITLAKSGKSGFVLVIPEEGTSNELKAAQIFQSYFFKVTGVQLQMIKSHKNISQPFISIGNTGLFEKHGFDQPSKPDAFFIRLDGNNLFINGSEGMGVIYGVYTFIERYMGCRKYDGSAAVVPRIEILKIQKGLSLAEQPAFNYREVYLPVSKDQEYLDWHKLHRFEELWGLWGHSFHKLVPPDFYFKDHPEYFSLVNGRRTTDQLCLTNDSVFNIVKEQLQKRISENTNARFWSISPNDGNGHCECAKCKKIDDAEGGPQGSLIYFVNKIAALFPDQNFTTLAYTYSKHPPLHLKTAPNVFIFLSTIDAFRTRPLPVENSAAVFRNDLAAWKEKTNNLFAWDYITQFTNYLAPFPNIHTYDVNLKYLADNGVVGILEQGSGDTYSDLQELKSYVLAKLLWDPGLSAEDIVAEFIAGYYMNASKYIQSYFDLINKALSSSHTNLDIYGNPINDHGGYLSPEFMDAYSALMDKAESVSENDPVLHQRVMRLRLAQEYTFLQQSRFYGTGPHGIFFKNAQGAWVVKSGFSNRINRFVTDCKNSGVIELSEGGMTPEEYSKEWNEILHNGVRTNLAGQSKVTLAFPPIPDFLKNSPAILTDSKPGYRDFSYNWLCFYDSPMIATLDLSTERTVHSISLDFLYDPRHWYFLPESVEVYGSVDGKEFTLIGQAGNVLKEVEDFTVEKKEYRFKNPQTGYKIRYVKVKALNQQQLPFWRMHKTKRPMLACDEVWVD